MSKSQRKQWVPIFVGSTFKDLQPYRRSARDALSQLETVVRGMEYFGSKPGKPVDECLKIVKTCAVYIGVFGMRYGSVPDGYERSMTHLEYDEAQHCKIPSLIYILDAEQQAILPKFVETGPGAESLRALKKQLEQMHTVSYFTTTEDLAAKILHDVPALLSELGKVVGSMPSAQEDATAVIARFQKLPAMNRGREVVLDVTLDELYSVGVVECEALNLPAGASLFWKPLMPGRMLSIYASNEVAEQLLDAERGSAVRLRCMTTYGTSKEPGLDFDTNEINEYLGFTVREVLSVRPRKSR